MVRRVTHWGEMALWRKDHAKRASTDSAFEIWPEDCPCSRGSQILRRAAFESSHLDLLL
jgi:hypothetical protein